MLPGLVAPNFPKIPFQPYTVLTLFKANDRCHCVHPVGTGPTKEDSLRGVEDQGSHTLLVIGENSFCLASMQVPEPDGTIMAACHHL